MHHKTNCCLYAQINDLLGNRVELVDRQLRKLLGGVADQPHSPAHASASFATQQGRALLRREHFLSPPIIRSWVKRYRRQSPVNLHMQKDLSV